MKELIERLRDDSARHDDETRRVCNKATNLIEQQAAEIERHKQNWNRFHHIMQKHGLHPGRTDDDLLEILDADLAASKVGLHNLREKNVQARAERDVLQAKLSAMEAVEPVGEVSGNDWSSAILYRDLEPGSPVYAAPKVEQPPEALEALFTNIDHAISSGAWKVQEGSQTWETIQEAKAAIGGQQP